MLWEKNVSTTMTGSEDCLNDIHLWAAHFYIDGSLAFWKCLGCGKTCCIREKSLELQDFSTSWIEDPLKLVHIGPFPQRRQRKWIQSDGSILTEGDPSSILYEGLEIPYLEMAHSYTLSAMDGSVIDVFQPAVERIRPHDDHYILTRYQVIESELIKFWCHCFEDSMYEMPNVALPTRTVLLSDLRFLVD